MRIPGDLDPLVQQEFAFVARTIGHTIPLKADETVESVAYDKGAREARYNPSWVMGVMACWGRDGGHCSRAIVLAAFARAVLQHDPSSMDEVPPGIDPECLPYRFMGSVLALAEIPEKALQIAMPTLSGAPDPASFSRAGMIREGYEWRRKPRKKRRR